MLDISFVFTCDLCLVVVLFARFWFSVIWVFVYNVRVGLLLAELVVFPVLCVVTSCGFAVVYWTARWLFRLCDFVYWFEVCDFG